MCRDGEDDGRARKAQVIRMGKKEGKKKDLRPPGA